jgi:diguanylate cyclase (GGDEF)-like protein
MFNSARHSMPTVEYVSTVSSVFKDRSALLFGGFTSGLAAAVSAYKTDFWGLYVVAGLFIVVGLARYAMMSAFWKANIGADDIEGAAHWEKLATWGGVAVASVYGIWSFVALVYVDDAFTEASALSLSMAAMVGVVARNFGLDRLVTLQSGILSLFMTAGFVMAGDLFYSVLALLLVIMLVSFRKLARDARMVLLNAVNGRISASRLATELDTALSTMPHGLCMLDKDGRINVVNRQAQLALFGNMPEFAVGRQFSEVLERAQAEGLISTSTGRYIESELTQGGQSKLVLSVGDDRQWELTINSKRGHTVVMMEDISERVKAAERITYMARYDDLTSLANRSFFSEQVDARLKELGVNQQETAVAMMVVDIDDFKHINDTLGHLAGDAVLVEAAERLQAVLGENGTICRFGGDEFMIFVCDDVSEEKARDDANAVLAALHTPMSLQGQTLSVRVSVGIAVADGVENDFEELLTKADLALHKAKAEGKARYCLFHTEMDVQYRHRQRLKADLAQALDRDELYLVYQPIVNLNTGRITGCEALVRWRHGELGVISPLDFIPTAEETGMMSEISRFVMKEATRECAQWADGMTVSVNLSAVDFRDADVEQMVDEALIASGLSPERLTVEITETAIIEELDGALKALSAIREKGVHVALDDFGTGYSSLSYLNSLPFTRLKIDRSFVKDVVANVRSQRLLANIAQLSNDLDLNVTVEGIETEEQLEVISGTAHIDLVQGFLFGAPLPKTDIAELIVRMQGGPSGLQALAAAAKRA